MTLEDPTAEVLTASAREGDSPLTPRELEIAGLVAQGLTNSEISQILFISRRTVETHVEHIKAKLGFARRVRIITWMLDRKS